MKNILLYVLLLFSFSTAAQEPTSLTTSGGVSLGSYEGGFLYYSIYNMPTRFRKSPMIFTGASAGAINSLLAGMTYCSGELSRNDNYKNSLFWKMWAPLSFDNFTSVNNGQSLLDRSFMNPFLASLENLWKQGLIKGCEFYIGVSLTRKTPLIFYPKIGSNYPRLYEPIAFKVRGQGKGVAPLVENVYLDSGVQIFMPFNISGFDNFRLIKKVLLASSSFPIAFPPEELSYCFIDSNKKLCKKESIKNDLFIDGGVFNNSPLDIAFKISKTMGLNKKTKFYYLNPSIKRYPEFGSIKNNEIKNKGLIRELMDFFQDFVTYSRVGNMSTFLGEHPGLAENLESVKTSIPLASDPMYGFFGFFDQDFRVFDFYLGMLEAKKLLENKKNITKDEFYRLETRWKMLECLDAAVYENFSISEICIKDINNIYTKNFRALFKTSIDQLFHHCSEAKHEGESIYSPLCTRISEKKLEDTIFETWRKKEPMKLLESHSGYVSRLLAENGFEFQDLKIKRGQEQLAMIAIKNKISKAIKGVREQQPSEHRFVLSQFSSPALNFIYYSPPLIKNYILAGGNVVDVHRSHVSYGESLFGHYFRYGYGININGIKEVLKNDEYGIGLLPNLSLSYEIKSLSSELWQNEFGLRLGYQFSSKNDFKLEECEISKYEREFTNCSHSVVQLIYGLTFLEKIRLQFMVNWIPFADKVKNRVRNAEFLLGWQF